MRFVFVVKSKISLSTALFFLFFLSQTSSGFNTCEIHSHAITEKKKRSEFLWLFQFLWLFSLRKRAFLFSVVALFRSIDDEEEF